MRSWARGNCAVAHQRNPRLASAVRRGRKHQRPSACRSCEQPRIAVRPICGCWCSCECRLGNGQEARIPGVPTSHRAPDCYVITIRAGLPKGKYRDSLICFAKELRPVSKATCHESSVDQVEFLSVYPRIFRVVNDELRVRWNTAGTGQPSVFYGVR